MKKYCKLFLAVLLCALLAFSAAACSSENKTQDVTESTAPALSESASEQDVTGESQTEEDSTAQEDSTAENQNNSGKETTEKGTTKKHSSDNSVDFTVQQALEALDNYYGSGYEVNGTVTEGDYYYFAVYKNDEKYASVKVNMKNGDAVETITETGETANLNLFV